MFSQACVKNSVHREGDVRGKGEACTAKGVGMHGEGRHAWQRGACMVRGACMAKEGVCVAKGACMAKGGMHGKQGHVW